ncbi:hypothetical protein [Haloferula sp.]|uniref:hypothetical protein n=1 Tax=Haloferula sp. TaxID=2497595 RepID=UPI00329DED34
MRKATKKKVKWWNNGWIGLAVLLVSLSILFVVGKHSPEYQPDPVIEGRRLSEWANDVKKYSWRDVDHYKAVEVLKAHKDELKPVLVEWLDERDSIPQVVYLTTMSLLEGKRNDLLDYRGAYFNQVRAANALREIGDTDPEIISGLNRVVRQYGSTRHYAAEVAEDTLNKLQD